MLHKDVNFANLTQEQLTAIQLFEKDFNTKYGSDFYIMALNNK